MSRLGVVDSKHDIVLDTIVESGFGAFLGRRVGDYTMRPKLGDHPKGKTACSAPPLDGVFC